MNFALILFLLTVATGIVWLAEKLVLRPRRRAAAAEALAAFDASHAADRNRGGEALARERAALEQRLTREPAWIEYSASFFPVLVIVFLLRSFLAEPFRIPSSSMRPTLVVGDYILVNKFVYGIRLPIIEKKVIPLGNPRHGDVVVFRYPVNPSQDFIKRVVAVGGDTVEYVDKVLSVNGKPLPQRPDGSYSYLEGLRFETTERRVEEAPRPEGGYDYTIAINREAAPVYPANVRSFPGRSECAYNERGFRCKVPAGHYFVMGDNRDASDDSRYWGFVPDDHIRGRAFFIWFNWDDIASFAFDRVGSGIR
jgi:signal peptidase I